MNNFAFELGATVRDKFTSFQGTVMARIDYFTTDVRMYGILNLDMKSRPEGDYMWIDENSLDGISPGPQQAAQDAAEIEAIIKRNQLTDEQVIDALDNLPGEEITFTIQKTRRFLCNTCGERIENPEYTAMSKKPICPKCNNTPSEIEKFSPCPVCGASTPYFNKNSFLCHRCYFVDEKHIQLTIEKYK